MTEIPLPPGPMPDGPTPGEATMRALLILAGPTGDPLAVGAVPVDPTLLQSTDPLLPRPHG